MYGLSDYSSVSTILCATQPATPVAPVTTVSTNTVVISWVAPSWNGSLILGYQVFVGQKDATFSENLVECNGRLDPVKSSFTCVITF